MKPICPPPNQAMNILLVEDDPQLRTHLAALLETQGYTVNCTDNATDAIKLARQYKPETILLDIKLRQSSGSDVCQKVRANPELAETQIIVITVLTDKIARLRLLAEGADDVIAKPLDIDELLAKLNTVARLQRFNRLHEAVNQNHVIRRAYLARLGIDSEEQRHQIAQQLHDTIGQSLTAINLIAQRLRDPDLSPAKRTDYINQLIASAKTAAHDVQTLSQTLHAPSVHEQGLAATIAKTIISHDHRCRITTALAPDPLGLGAGPTEIIYRIFVELLASAIRNGYPAALDISLKYRKGNAHLTLIENEPTAPDTTNSQTGRTHAPVRPDPHDLNGRIKQMGGSCVIKPGRHCVRTDVKLPAFLGLS